MTARTISTRDTWREGREGTGGLTDRQTDGVSSTWRWWWRLQQLPGRSVDDMTKYFPRRILFVPFHLPFLVHRFRFTTSLRHHLQAPKVAFDFDGKASSLQPAATPTFVLLPYDLYAIAFCGNVSSMSPETCMWHVCVSKCTYVGQWALHTSATALWCAPSLSLSSSPLVQSPCFIFLLLPFPLRFVHFIVDSIIFYSHASANFGIFNLFRNFWTLYENKKIDMSVSVRVWRSVAGQVNESQTQCS